MAYIQSSGSYCMHLSVPGLLTSDNSYVTYASIPVACLTTKRMYFSAATQDLDAKILGSFDGGTTYPIEVVAEFSVATATPVIQTITDLYTDLRVQVKPAVADTHGTLSLTWAGWSQ